MAKLLKVLEGVLRILGFQQVSSLMCLILYIYLFAIIANIEEEVVESLPEGLITGIYHGFAAVDNGTIHDMVMSIGWNPYYQNQKKSMVLKI